MTALVALFVATTDAAIGSRPQRDDLAFVQRGDASWYGPRFHGRKTASGVRFDQNKLTAAHRDLPLGSEVTVTNLDNGQSVRVEINDRGPYINGRIIDLSKAAAHELGMIQDGVVPVKVEATTGQMTITSRHSGRDV
ncbi:MAG: septal ring lytic transglycosylase RlpA family protein [Defluviicoccus sp.]